MIHYMLNGIPGLRKQQVSVFLGHTLRQCGARGCPNSWKINWRKLIQVNLSRNDLEKIVDLIKKQVK